MAFRPSSKTLIKRYQSTLMARRFNLIVAENPVARGLIDAITRPSAMREFAFRPHD